MSNLSHVPEAMLKECEEMGFTPTMILAMFPMPKEKKDRARKAHFAGQSPAASKDPVMCTIHVTCMLCGTKEDRQHLAILKASDPVEWDSVTSLCNHCSDVLANLDHKTLVKLVMIMNSPVNELRMKAPKEQIRLAKKWAIEDILHYDVPERKFNLTIPDEEK